MFEKKVDPKWIKCPFYKEQDDYRIRCEGLVPNSSIILAFETKASKVEWRAKYCYCDYERCKVYFLDNNKYDDCGNLK